MALRDYGVDACLPRGPRFGRIGGGGEEKASGLLECRDAGWIGQSEVEADDRRREFDQDGKHRVVLDEAAVDFRSEEHTSELQSLMRISYAVFCLKKKNI